MLNVREIPTSGILSAEHPPVPPAPDRADRADRPDRADGTAAPAVDPLGPTSRTLIGLLARSIRLHPNRPAVADDRQTLTYAQLDRHSDLVAAALSAQGVTVEHRVGIHLQRSVDLVVAVLGVLKAGAAYVAIDTRYPPARRDLMLSASGARVVLTESAFAAALRPVVRTVLLLDQAVQPDETGQVGGVRTTSQPVVTDSMAACVMFTSGSAGTPKGIVLEHANLVSFAVNSGLPQLTPRDRVGQISSVSFDAFHFELWSTLAAGAELIILPAVTDLIAADFQRQMRRYGISAMLVPTMVVNHVVREDRDAFSSLRLLQVGGDVLQPWACRDLLAGKFEGELYNLYGPSEITTACTAHRVTREDAAGETIPIGQPLDGVTLQVVSADLRPVPVGEIGELLVSGPGVARGYLDAPELTADRFRTDPASGLTERYYRTGDLVRARADGALLFIGRVDDQVKIRGYRVELGEVERGLARHPAVREAVILADGEGDGRRLIAFVVPEGSLSMKDLRTHAAAELPHFMVPSTILQLSQIPAGDHGKRDLDALRLLLAGHRERTRTYVPPVGETARYLADLWTELLGVEQIGMTDDFFALGGHSLLVFRMRRQIEREWGVVVDHQTMWSTTGLADLTRVLDDLLCAVPDRVEP